MALTRALQGNAGHMLDPHIVGLQRPPPRVHSRHTAARPPPLPSPPLRGDDAFQLNDWQTDRAAGSNSHKVTSTADRVLETWPGVFALGTRGWPQSVLSALTFNPKFCTREKVSGVIPCTPLKHWSASALCCRTITVWATGQPGFFYVFRHSGSVSHIYVHCAYNSSQRRPCLGTQQRQCPPKRRPRQTMVPHLNLALEFCCHSCKSPAKESRALARVPLCLGPVPKEPAQVLRHSPRSSGPSYARYICRIIWVHASRLAKAGR